ncbi:MAG: hypothetical protein K2K04_05675, partial [Clostridia bacterium]|nr:hypothetical protein [Clostridia bacterium]
INSNNIIQIPDTKICVEYFLPRNISNYAMLGIEFKNTDSECLNIRLFDCADKIKYVPTIQCTDKNCKHSGFLSEYSLAVMQQTQQFFKTSQYGLRGELSFVLGAYCDVGSSISSFKLATNILLSLLFKHEEKTILQTINEEIN